MLATTTYWPPGAAASAEACKPDQDLGLDAPRCQVDDGHRTLIGDVSHGVHPHGRPFARRRRQIAREPDAARPSC